MILGEENNTFISSTNSSNSFRISNKENDYHDPSKEINCGYEYFYQESNNSDRDFDCIMGMSGGIDSSYLLYIMVHKYGLRPLVFHVDAGWNSQIAVNNIERLVDSLGLDLYTEVIDWEEMSKPLEYSSKTA